jgi:uncharacterized Zn ribbon protein
MQLYSEDFVTGLKDLKILGAGTIKTMKDGTSTKTIY